MRKGILCVLCVEQMVSKSSLKLPVPTVFTSTTETSAVGQLSPSKSSPSMGRYDCGILWVGTNANNRTDKVKKELYIDVSSFLWLHDNFSAYKKSVETPSIVNLRYMSILYCFSVHCTGVQMNWSIHDTKRSRTNWFGVIISWKKKSNDSISI